MAPLIGILALQGAFREHGRMLRSLGADVREIRLPRDLRGLHGLAMPGGESTTMGKLMERYGLKEPLRQFAERRPVLATCAGLILLARELSGGTRQPLLGVLDIVVERNAYGRQVDSFEAPVRLLPPVANDAVLFPGVFIRAPRITQVGPQVSVMATLDHEPVGVVQGHILALTFHPELTSDVRLHAFFLSLVAGEESGRGRLELSLTEV